MDINNSGDGTETCDVLVGEKLDRPCERPKDHKWAHAVGLAPDRHTIFYDREDPTQSDFDNCRTCLEPITDQNRATGRASALYCLACIGPVQEAAREANRCKACGFEGPHEMRNYSMMWHEADIHCGRCGAFHRYWDAG